MHRPLYGLLVAVSVRLLFSAVVRLMSCFTCFSAEPLKLEAGFSNTIGPRPLFEIVALARLPFAPARHALGNDSSQRDCNPYPWPDRGISYLNRMAVPKHDDIDLFPLYEYNHHLRFCPHEYELI